MRLLKNDFYARFIKSPVVFNEQLYFMSLGPHFSTTFADGIAQFFRPIINAQITPKAVPRTADNPMGPMFLKFTNKYRMSSITINIKNTIINQFCFPWFAMFRMFCFLLCLGLFANNTKE